MAETQGFSKFWDRILQMVFFGGVGDDQSCNCIMYNLRGQMQKKTHQGEFIEAAVQKSWPEASCTHACETLLAFSCPLLSVFFFLRV